MSCDDCALRLVVVDRDVVDGALVSVVLAVEYQGESGAPAPHLADVRLAFNGPWQVLEVGLGTPLVEAGKSLFIDPEAGAAWQTLPDGNVRTLLMSTGGTTPLPEGRWVYFRVAPDTALAPPALPLVASLVPREGTLAPRASDEALWGEALDQPVVVWPVDVLGPAPVRGSP